MTRPRVHARRSSAPAALAAATALRPGRPCSPPRPLYLGARDRRRLAARHQLSGLRLPVGGAGAPGAWACSCSLPFVLFAVAHALAARTPPQPPRRAHRLRAGRRWRSSCCVTGLALLRVAGIELRAAGRAQPSSTGCTSSCRSASLWAFLQHRRRGRRAATRRRRGPGAWSRSLPSRSPPSSTCASAGQPLPPAARVSFAPSFARTATGRTIPRRGADGRRLLRRVPHRRPHRRGCRARIASARSTTRSTPPASRRPAR